MTIANGKYKKMPRDWRMWAMSVLHPLPMFWAGWLVANNQANTGLLVIFLGAIINMTIEYLWFGWQRIVVDNKRRIVMED